MEPRPAPLDAAVAQAVAALCREARLHHQDGHDGLALQAYLDAWDLMPEPREAWAASAGILDAVAGLLQHGAAPDDALVTLVRARGRTAAA